MKELAAGEITPKEAKKKRNRAKLQDLASIGIAGIGIKGAYSEWKEMKEQRDEAKEFDKKREERHERRLHKHGENGSTSSPGYGSEQGTPYENGAHDPYRPTAAPDLAPGYYPEPPGAQPGGYYGDPGHPGGPAAPHYSDDNPFHVGGVPPPPMGPDPQRY